MNPNPNNGTLRLPLKPVGLHSPDAAASEPSDPVDSTSTTEPGTGFISISPVEASSAVEPAVVPPHLVGVDPVSEEDKPVAEDKGSMTDDEKDQKDEQDFWDYFFGKLDGLKDWFGNLVSGVKEEDG